MIESDVIILGGGIAGVSLAGVLAGKTRVTLIEIEEQLGRHATGRSAAMFFESYGNVAIRTLTRASRSFLLAPPVGFVETPLLQGRAALHVAPHENIYALDRLQETVPDAPLQPLTCDQARALVPILSEDWLGGGLLDPSGFDVDVAVLLQGYARYAQKAGAAFETNAKHVDIENASGRWIVATGREAYYAPVLVNATGAWADEVAVAAGVPRLGLRPLRRTAMTIPAPTECDIASWPLVIDVDESFYFKPDAGQLLLSPANEDPDLPGDSAPDELDLAIAVDRFQIATSINVKRISHRWSGLRTFAPDRTPVVGFDRHKSGFFWLAGQGGYGVQTAPAMANVAAALILDDAEALPTELYTLISQLCPGRFGVTQRKP